MGIQDKLQIVAIHEAGHQLAFWLLRRTACSIEILVGPTDVGGGNRPERTKCEDRDRDRWGLTEVSPDGANIDAIRADGDKAIQWIRDEIKILAAGEAAQRLFGLPVFPDGLEGDVKQVDTILAAVETIDCKQVSTAMRIELYANATELLLEHKDTIAALAKALTADRCKLIRGKYTCYSMSAETARKFLLKVVG